MRTYTIAGVSFKDGEYKIHGASNPNVVDFFESKKHEDIRLIELPNAMTKIEACEYLLDIEDFQDQPIQDVLKNYIDRHSDKPVKTKPNNTLLHQVVMAIGEILVSNEPDAVELARSIVGEYIEKYRIHEPETKVVLRVPQRMTFEQALQKIPTRDEFGDIISTEDRELQALDLMERDEVT